MPSVLLPFFMILTFCDVSLNFSRLSKLTEYSANYFPAYFFAGEEYLAFKPSKISRVML